MSISYPKETCACFTGHRAMTESEKRSAAAEIERAIASLAARGILHYYAGGAVGFDMVAAVTVLNAKQYAPALTLTLALPCRNHTLKWGRAERELFERVASLADEVIYVSEDYHRGCMQQRNCYMVDRSAVCLSYLKEPKGGTYNTVRYAERQGLEIQNLADVRKENR